MGKKQRNQPWYRRGLRFECTGCGECCSGAAGYVWCSVEEIQKMADYLELSVEEFSKRYVKKVGRRFSLIDRVVGSRDNRECIFLKDKRCTIYSVRPTQCRTFPWWPQYLSSPQAWRNAARGCEGICDSAKVVAVQDIERQKALQEASGE